MDQLNSMLYLGELNGSRTHNYPDIRIEHYQGASESVPIKERKGVQVQINVCPRGQTNCLSLRDKQNVTDRRTDRLTDRLTKRFIYIEGNSALKQFQPTRLS